MNAESPGPQAYGHKSTFEENKEKKRGFSCRGKTADPIALELSKYPGPGQYNSTFYNKPKAPRCASANNLRRTFADVGDADKNQPGPGQLDPNNIKFNLSKNRSAAAYQFGSSNRRPLSDYERTPASNYYESDKKLVMRSAPKFSVTKATKKEFPPACGTSPGPADYNPSIGFIK